MFVAFHLIEPCLPSADRRASGPDWIHEIKHDGLRLMVRRDPAGVRIDDGREGR
jgi:ATP-dependent DNA ligase